MTDQRRPVYAYSARARFFHWLTVLLVAIQFPLGFYMTYRGYELEYAAADGTIKKGLFDSTTGLLYDSHKLIGLTILLFVVVRLINRISSGAPPPEPDMPAKLIVPSRVTHWSLYGLLLVMPIIGYTGVSYYGATEAFGLPIPSLFPKDQKFSETVFDVHETIAIALLALIGLHVAAALYHRFVRKDSVLARMWPGR